MPLCDPTPTLLVPGFAGSPEGHWQHIWAEERPHARMIAQQDWFRPRLDAWRATLEAALLETDGAYLVAHSLGSVLTARMAESPAASRIRGALLVAPCDLDVTGLLHPDLIHFGDMPVERLPFPAVVLGSRNDTYMQEDRARSFAGLWGADYLDMGNAGHINLASGFGRFKRGYQALDALAARTEARNDHPRAPEVQPGLMAG
nr:alpha/beta hydrolase [uncultured Gellertiella sp.]